MARRWMEPWTVEDKRRDEAEVEDGFHEAIPAAPVRPYAYRDAYAPVAIAPADRLASFIMAVAWIVEGILALRVLLEAFAAPTSSAFANFIYTISYPLAWPFVGIAGSTAVGTGGILDWAAIIAVGVYGIVAYVLVRALHSARDAIA